MRLDINVHNLSVCFAIVIFGETEISPYSILSSVLDMTFSEHFHSLLLYGYILFALDLVCWELRYVYIGTHSNGHYSNAFHVY